MLEAQYNAQIQPAAQAAGQNTATRSVLEPIKAI